MIRALWRVARVRYGLCEDNQPLELPSPDFTPERLRAMERSPTREMTMPVFTEFKKPTALCYDGCPASLAVTRVLTGSLVVPAPSVGVLAVADPIDSGDPASC